METRAEQVRILYEQAPLSIAAGMGVATLVFLFTRHVSTDPALIVWYTVLLGISVLRLLMVRSFRQLQPANEQVGVWQRRFDLGAFAAGCVWGTLIWLLDPAWPLPYQALIYVALLGVASGALSSDGLLTRTFMLFATPMIAPIALSLARVGDGSHLGMAVMVGLYLGVIYYASLGYQRNLGNSLLLQNKNAALLESLSRTNVGLQIEINERKRAEAALSREKERAEVTLHSIADAVISTDENGCINYLNPVAEKLTGWSVTEAVGRPLQDVFMTEEVGGDIGMPVGAVQQEMGQRLLRDRNGGQATISHTSAPIRTGGGRELGTVLVFQDISPMRDMERELAYHASHDALTRLINRREFELRLGKALERTQLEKVQHVLLYLDLDQFKVVNDTCGHRAGDELLRQLSKILADALRRTDILARLGGDEFGVLLEACPLDVGMRIAEGLRGLVKEFRFFWDSKTFDVGVSIGVVPITDDGSSASDLLSAADMACYAAKDLGRNRAHVYEPENAELARRQGEMRWISRITSALEEDRLRLYYQEIVQLNDQPALPRHIEVLLRMEGEQGELVPPNAFLPAAERYNLMPTLDRWVIARAFDWCRSHGGEGLVCAINLSGTSLNDQELISYIREQFERTGIKEEGICFEITETAAVANLGAASELIQELRNAGCQFSLDDFGSGLSSFAYLKHLPVDFLKIDGEFVRDIANDSVDRAMVAAIHTLARVMGKQTIAEFVENDATLEELGKIGVDFAQGYAIGRPAPLDGQLELMGQMAPEAARG